MLPELLTLLRCPLTREPLTLETIREGKKKFISGEETIIETGILRSSTTVYPIIEGIPRLLVEAMDDYADFFRMHLADFDNVYEAWKNRYAGLRSFVLKKNRRTKQSFSQEWGLFNYEEDKVWDADADGMLDRFLRENQESKESLKGKWILDAGCGNGLLNQSIAACGAYVLGLDFSQSIIRAYQKNAQRHAFFIQADVQFPPLAVKCFDIVHSSGVLICTTNSELTFSCLDPCVKPGGKISVWLYHPRKNTLHNFFNWLREYTSRLPIQVQYRIYQFTLLPLSFVIKRLKGNKQNTREMMIDILDWFSPEFRWEHAHDEAAAWFYKRQYQAVQVSTDELFGFNIIGTKEK